MRIFLRKSALSLLGSAILAFGLYNVHAFSGVTEGGILGFSLFLDHWFSISPAVSNLILNTACYLFGLKTLGKTFILYSFVAGSGFSLFYALFEQFPPLWPSLASMPLLAALVGAVFVGVGIGLSVRAGGAPGGDDALAMTLGHLLHQPIERIYLVSDLTALTLCATYLPLKNLACSLLTVVLSGQLIGLIQRLPSRKSPS
ncbi:MAG: YitT family protein [Clostridia bacterium]|nr:YitT family protein [Clostridia bacterium]